MSESGPVFLSVSKVSVRKAIAAVFLASITSLSVLAQSVGSVPYKSQEFSEADGIPVLVKHLPDWENRRASLAFSKSTGELRAAVGERPIVDLIDFIPGTEAATAQYDAGRLLIVEYASPQVSTETDDKLTAAIAASGDGKTFVRRIGNYNVILFDAPNATAANELIDQVKYEKQVQWLGKNPFSISAERAFVLTTTDIFMSTLMVIVGGVVFSIMGGLLVGFVFFSFRDRRRANMGKFSDAGGMTRLNLDGFTPDITPERLLGD